tara:strand:+ start:758 stop:1630 length:873 start_codon:yes stop_codon:yes gene_type:complete
MTIILRSQRQISRSQDRSAPVVKHFIPTMGSLHAGHISLVKKAKEIDGKTYVSIFVNPIQFDKKSDFLSYPKKVNEDIKILKNLEVDFIFIPDNSFVNSNSSSLISLNNFNDVLCAKDRPNHFNGVATVIIKFLNLIKPNHLYLGEKDYQQILVIKQIIKDFYFSTKISILKTIRENDGLALSSRNSLLTQKQRIVAVQLYKCLKLLKKNANTGTFQISMLKELKRDLLKNGFDKINYLEIRKNDDLTLLDSNLSKARAFVSGTLGKVRLIDNLFLGYLRIKKNSYTKLN